MLEFVYREFAPSSELAAFVECFWYLRARGLGHWESIYPDGCAELVLNLSDPSEELRGTRVERQPRWLLYGPFDERIRIRSATETEVVAIRFRPWGVAPVMCVPAARLARLALAFEQVEPTLARRLVSVIETDESTESKVHRLDEELLHWVRAHGKGETGTASFARYLQTTPTARLKDVTSLTGWSTRAAQRHFSNDIGLSPKRFLQITRFMRFLKLLENESNAPLATLAVAAGYYDQAHLHRDLRRFTGFTPASYRARTRETYDALYGPDRLDRVVAV